MKHRTAFPHGLNESLQNIRAFPGCSSLTAVAAARIAEVHNPFVLFIFLH